MRINFNTFFGFCFSFEISQFGRIKKKPVCLLFFSNGLGQKRLQLASIIYEHENDAVRKAVGLTADEEPSTYAPQLSSVVDNLTTNLSPTKHRPGKLLADLFGHQKSKEVANALDSEGDRRIREFAGRFGLDFEPLSGAHRFSASFFFLAVRVVPCSRDLSSS